MKKVLLIGYPFPLRSGGSPRLLGLAKYLPEFGWQPVILTAPLGTKDARFNIVETGYRETLSMVRKILKLKPDQDERSQLKRRLGVKSQRSLFDWLLTRVGEIVNYPDSDKGWRSFATDAGDKLISEGGFSAIISSSSPVTAHTIARTLKLRHNLPWVADLRDLWSQNHNYSYGRLRHYLDKRLELKTLADADVLVTVSKPWAEQLGSLHTGKNVNSITNGFDPEMVNNPPAKLTTKFTITYTGSIYAGKQEPAKLFAALRDSISQGKVSRTDVVVRFYGSVVSWLARIIDEYGLTDIVKCYGMVSQQMAAERQRESQVLLLLDWDDARETGVYPLKIFEYLAAKRPVLATGGVSGNAVDLLLKETEAGVQATSVHDIRIELERLYQEYKANGKIAYCGDEIKINKYSYRETARAFSRIIDECSAS